MADAIWIWLTHHYVAVVSVVVWFVASAVPRPHPGAVEPRWEKVFWTVIDRLAVLTAEDLPGKWKMILAASPLSEQQRNDGEAVDSTKKG